MLNNWYKKEKPFGGFAGFGGGATGLGFGGSSGFSATGGTVSTDGDYTFHHFTFPNSDNFEVKKLTLLLHPLALCQVKQSKESY